MQFKSQAQRAKFEELVKSGKMKQSVLDEWNHATADKELPERVPVKQPKEERKWVTNEKNRKARLRERNKSGK